MLLIHKKQMWIGFVCKESRLCFDFLDAAGNAIEGFAAAGTGAGELLRAVGGIANHLGKGTGWLVEQGPYAMFAAYLAMAGKGQDVWGDIFLPDFPDSLMEYHAAGLILPNPFDARYIDTTKTPPEFKRAEYNRDWKAGWHKRYGLIEREILKIRILDLAYAQAELVELNRRIDTLEDRNVDKLAFERPKLKERLEEINELLHRRLNKERRRALTREQREIFAKLGQQNSDMDLGNQPWLVFENGAPKLDPSNPSRYLTYRIDLKAKQRELKRAVGAGEEKIAFYENQQERILKCVDPEDKIALEKDYRKARFEEIMIKAGMEVFLTP